MVAERDRVAAGRHAELTAECSVHPVELAEGRVPIAIGGVLSHQREVRGLVGRIQLHDRRPPPVEPEQVELAKPKLLAALLGPILVAVVGKQLAGVQPECRTGCDRVTALQGSAGEVLELDDVDGDIGLRTEGNRVAAEHHGIRDLHRPASEMRRLVELRRSLVDAVVGPQAIEHLLAVHAHPGREGKDLHERCGVTARPVTVCDGHRVDGHIEAPEHRDVDRGHASVVRARAPDT